MRLETKQVYISDDGNDYLTEEECLKADKEFADLKARTTYWSIVYCPDLTEGRGYTKMVVAKAIANKYNAKMLIEDYCFRMFGRKVAFVQGVSPMENWVLREIDEERYNSKTFVACGDYKYDAKKITLAMGNDVEGLIEFDE